MSRQTEKNTKNALSMKAKIAMLICIPLAVIVICSVVIVITVHKMDNNTPGSDKPHPTAQPVMTAPQSDEGASVQANELLSSILNTTDAQTVCSTSVSVDIVNSNLSESGKHLLDYAAGKMGGAIAGGFYNDGNYSSAYGSANKLTDGILPAKNAKVAFTEEEDGTFSYLFPPAEGFDGLFAPSDETMAGCVAEKIKEYFSADECYAKVNKDATWVSLTADPTDGRLTSVAKIRNFTAEVSFRIKDGETTKITAQITVTGTIDVSFAGIEIEQDIIEIHKNGYEELAVKANVDENASQEDFSVSFVSSDPSVCTVSDNGMIEAVSVSDFPVTVTVTLVYLGKTYTDSCLVYVTESGNTLTAINGMLSPRTALVAKIPSEKEVNRYG